MACYLFICLNVSGGDEEIDTELTGNRYCNTWCVEPCRLMIHL